MEEQLQQTIANNFLEQSPELKRVIKRPRQILNYKSVEDSVMTKLKDRLTLMKSQLVAEK